ncbi:MAG: DUF4097 family beta strand repeat-containing protein [Acidobacteriota bacterium]|nr:DUF4097 family beta strand repeat-containing protein [Acidobacteriota bacterium]
MFRAIARFSLVLLAALPVGAAAREMHNSDAVALSAAVAPQAAARTVSSTPSQSDGGDPWCKEALRNNDDDDRDSACEVREFTMPRGSVSAETSNGSIRVTGEDRGDVFVKALVMATARSEERANEILKEVKIDTAGGLRADGPRNLNRASWWVSFRIQAPKTTDVTLRSSNGSLGVTDVNGTMRLRTSNGSIKLMDVGGDVEADTSNGSVNATLGGRSWQGAGLNVTTSNGSVRVTVPDNYNARLVAGTSNGSINVDFPITVQRRINRDIDTNLGSGGPTIRLRTSNGSVRVEKR